MNTSISNRLCLGIGLCVVGSFFAAFFLFAIAFNTPFAQLRASFLPIYFGIVVLCLFGSIIAQGRVVPILTSALTLPALVLLYIASQNRWYYLDTLILIALCYVVSFFARLAAKDNKQSSQPNE